MSLYYLDRNAELKTERPPVKILIADVILYLCFFLNVLATYFDKYSLEKTS